MPKVTSEEIAEIAGRALQDPENATPEDIRRLAASCLAQVEEEPNGT